MNNEYPIPEPLFSCLLCSDEFSWPAKDLRWSHAVDGWICAECWDWEEHGERSKSIRLSDLVEVRRKPATQP